jgi:hypothetical protein
MSLPNEPREHSDGRKVRYAVVGAGWISQGDFMLGVEHTGNSVITALVTGDPAKAKALSKKYGIPHLYDYDGYEEMLHSGDVDAVYLAFPNSMHRDYAVAALNCCKVGAHGPPGARTNNSITGSSIQRIGRRGSAGWKLADCGLSKFESQSRLRQRMR